MRTRGQLPWFGVLLGALGCHTTSDYVGKVEQSNTSAGALSDMDGDDEDEDEDEESNDGLFPIAVVFPPNPAADSADKEEERNTDLEAPPAAGGPAQAAEGDDEGSMAEADMEPPRRPRTGFGACTAEQALRKLGFQQAWLDVGETCQVRVSITWNAQDFWNGRSITMEQLFFYEALLAGRPPSPKPSDGICPEDQQMSWWREYQFLVGETYHLCPGLCAKAAELIPEVIAFGCGEEVSPELERILTGGSPPPPLPPPLP